MGNGTTLIRAGVGLVVAAVIVARIRRLGPHSLQAQASAGMAAERRRGPGAARGIALAEPGPRARRPLGRGGRQRGAAARILLRRRRRRPVEDDRRRASPGSRSPTSTSSASVGAVAVSESNPDVVYIGMGETELRGNIMQGDGVYKSTDAGKTWKHVGLEKTRQISRIRVHPTNPDIVYVAALGHPTAPNAERGVFQSTDGGKTWQKVLFRNDTTGAVDLVDGSERTPTCCSRRSGRCTARRGRCRAAGRAAASSSRTDGGDTGPRSRATRAAGRASRARSASAVSRRRRASASTRSSKRTRAACSRPTMRGATWTQVNDDRNLRQRAFYYSRIYADPKAKDTVYVLNTGFYNRPTAARRSAPIARAARRQSRSVDRRRTIRSA